MRYVTVISRTTPKVRRPVEKKEHFISSSLRKTPIKLSKSRKFTIGHSSKSSLPLKSGTISATHASIKWNKSAYKIRDERSTNGTFVNGKRITGLTPLSDGDKIRLGQFVLTFSARKIRTKKDEPKKKPPKKAKKAATRRKTAKTSRGKTAASRRKTLARKRPAAAKRRSAVRSGRTARKGPLYTKIFGSM